jgi:hypothetical protein
VVVQSLPPAEYRVSSLEPCYERLAHYLTLVESARSAPLKRLNVSLTVGEIGIADLPEPPFDKESRNSTSLTNERIGNFTPLEVDKFRGFLSARSEHKCEHTRWDATVVLPIVQGSIYR